MIYTESNGSVKLLIVVFVVLTLAISSPLLWGHGIDVAVGKRYPCVFIKAEYSGGTAIGHGAVTLTYEAETDAFQKGYTDKNGTFSFCPHQEGQWTVVVDDLMGHRGSETITVDKSFFAGSTSAPANADKPTGTTHESEEQKLPVSKANLCCYLLRAALGVLLILVITFIFQRWKKKNEA